MGKIPKFIKINMILLVVILFLVSIISLFPKQIDTSLSGLVYRLGEDNTNDITKVNVEFTGNYFKNAFKEDIFKGYLTIKTEDKEASSYCEVYFNNKGHGKIYYDLEIPDMFPDVKINDMYINNNFSEVSMTLSANVIDNTSYNSWNTSEGYIFAAPATTRDDALLVSNELMNKQLSAILK